MCHFFVCDPMASKIYPVLNSFLTLWVILHAFLSSADFFFKINFSKNYFRNTVKPVLSGHLKIDKTKISMTNGSLMKVESIAECFSWSILKYV